MTVYVTQLAPAYIIPEGFIDLLREAAGDILKQHGLPSGQVGIILAGDKRLQELNYSYRGLDSPTDVLSFCMLDTEEERLAAAQDREILIGDIYISLDRARAQAPTSRGSCLFLQEVMQLAIHGLLHLAGFSHHDLDSGRVMSQQEREIFLSLAPKLM